MWRHYDRIPPPKYGVLLTAIERGTNTTIPPDGLIPFELTEREALNRLQEILVPILEFLREREMPFVAILYGSLVSGQSDSRAPENPSDFDVAIIFSPTPDGIQKPEGETESLATELRKFKKELQERLIKWDEGKQGHSPKDDNNYYLVGSKPLNERIITINCSVQKKAKADETDEEVEEQKTKQPLRPVDIWLWDLKSFRESLEGQHDEHKFPTFKGESTASIIARYIMSSGRVLDTNSPSLFPQLKAVLEELTGKRVNTSSSSST